MGPMSEGATTEPTVVHTSHSNRLTRGRLSGYPLLHQNFSTYFELSIHLTILEDGIL